MFEQGSKLNFMWQYLSSIMKRTSSYLISVRVVEVIPESLNKVKKISACVDSDAKVSLMVELF